MADKKDGVKLYITYKNNRATVEIEENGVRRKHDAIYQNVESKGQHEFCSDVATRVENETGKHVQWMFVNKDQDKKKMQAGEIVAITLGIVFTVGIAVYFIVMPSIIREQQTPAYKRYMDDYSTTEPTTNITTTPIETEKPKEKTFDFGQGTWEYNDLYTIYTGSLTNVSKYTHKFIKVKGTFQDENKNSIDTDWTFACGDEGLEPGETTTFTLSTKANPAIKNIHMEVYDYQ